MQQLLGSSGPWRTLIPSAAQRVMSAQKPLHCCLKPVGAVYWVLSRRPWVIPLGRSVVCEWKAKRADVRIVRIESALLVLAPLVPPSSAPITLSYPHPPLLSVRKASTKVAAILHRGSGSHLHALGRRRRSQCGPWSEPCGVPPVLPTSLGLTSHRSTRIPTHTHMAKYAAVVPFPYGILVHLSQPGTGNHVFFKCFHFFILIIIFWVENYNSLFIPLTFFSLFFHSCFSFLWHFHFSFLCFENGPWSLGIATRSFFSNPFRFSSFCFVSVSLWLFFVPLIWKLSLEIIKRSFFSNPFRFSSFLYRFAYVSFLCLQNWPWKLSKGTFSRTLFVFFVFVSFWICFLPLPSKLTLEIVKRNFFSNPFSFFFSFLLFFLLFLQNWPWKLSKGVFLEPVSFCFFFSPVFSFPFSWSFYVVFIFFFSVFLFNCSFFLCFSFFI